MKKLKRKKMRHSLFLFLTAVLAVTHFFKGS